MNGNLRRYLPPAVLLLAAIGALALADARDGFLLAANLLYAVGALWWVIGAAWAPRPRWPHALGMLVPIAPPTLYAAPLLLAGDNAVMGVFPLALAIFGAWAAGLIGGFLMLLRASWSPADEQDG